MQPLSTPADGLSDAQLMRVLYSNWDFQQALSALTFLAEECDFERKYSFVELRRFRCYEASAIISFCRPFESGRSSTTLSLKAIGVQLEAEERNLRNRLLGLRRKVVAHSDEDLMHFRGLVLQPIEGSEIGLPVFRYIESLHLQQAEISAFEALLHRLTHAIAHVLFAIAQRCPHRLTIYKTPVAQHGLGTIAEA